MAVSKKGPSASDIKRAKATLRQAGFSLAALAKSTGTTKNEVRSAFNRSATRLAAGRAAPLRAVRKASYGGKTAGVAKNPKRVAAVNKRAMGAKAAYGWTPPKVTRSTSKKGK